jgi:hypothetical protein
MFLRRKSKAYGDRLVIALLSLLIFALSAWFDVFDNIIGWIYRHDNWELDELFTVSVFLVLALSVYAWRRHREIVAEMRMRKQAEAEKALLIPELESARADVSALRRLLPICSRCKRIRDGNGYWSRVEEYMEIHYHTRMDDGLCPNCAKEVYGKSRR